jgi:hypothetical protein
MLDYAEMVHYKGSMVKTELVSVDEVIDALGGTNSVARQTGNQPSAISNWRRAHRLPAKMYLWFMRELDERGFDAHPRLWGMK